MATVSFHKHRGPGGVKFDARAHSGPQGGRADHGLGNVRRAGEYMVRVQANDESGEGGGGFQCCWTNAYVKVIIK